MTKTQKISLRDAVNANINELPVQHRLEGEGEWTDTKNPHFWTWSESEGKIIEWRVKPLPRKGYLVEKLDKEGRPFFTLSEAEAKEVARQWMPNGIVTQFVEAFP